MKTGNWLAASAAAFPERTALIANQVHLTYAELERRAAQTARRLAGLGAGPGARVALALDPSEDYVVVLHALMKLGAVAVPLDAASPDLEHRMEAAGVTLSVLDPAPVRDAPEAAVHLDDEIELDAVHCVIHTSGTAGEPKPVELTYANQLWSALGSGVRIGIHHDDRWLCCLPLHHIGGLAILLRSAIYGTAVVLERFDAEAIRALVKPERVTLASLVGTTLARLLDVGAELDRLRCVLLGGGPVPPQTIDRALDRDIPIAPTYGLTEAASQVTTLVPGEVRRKPGSAGTPILPAEVKVEDGLILVRGANVAPSALGDDGWLRTGDLGRIDEEGHLEVLGRADEVIVSGGENVSPEEVEQVLCAHPAVLDAAVSGTEDAEWGMAVTATVVLRAPEGATESELLDFCRKRLAGYKVPKRIAFADDLPRDARGKLRRREL